MASENSILAKLEQHVSRLRDTAARFGSEAAHLREEREIVMQYLSDFGTALKTLIGDRQASDARANVAEAENATLKAQIAADEATLKGMLDATNEEIGNETSAATPIVTTSPSGAAVTVDPAAGTTTHVNSAAGVTTVVPHDGSAPTATDAASTLIVPPPAAVAEALQATVDAGVTVPTVG